jgi:hypothetical protein
VKKGLLILAILLALFVGTAFGTYPAGVQAAMADPWEAIISLTVRVTNLEARVTDIENFLGIGVRNQPEEQVVEFNETDYPYLAILPPELEGKFEARYNFAVGTIWIEDKPTNEVNPITGELKFEKRQTEGISYEGVIRNISNETITIKYGSTAYVKDKNTGEIITDLGKGGCLAPQTFKPNQVRTFGTAMYDYYPPESFTEEIPDPQAVFVEAIIFLWEE